LSVNGEKVVKEYFEKLGLIPKKIKEGDTKTPDYAVYDSNNLLFFCEEKTLEYIDFKGWENDSSRNKISKHIYEAIKQFKAVNSEHKVPNILVFNNYDPMNNPHDLFTTLTGYAISVENVKIKLHKVGRIEKDLDLIDLFLWFENGQLVNHIWSGLHKEHNAKLKSILSLLSK
jgi:hypothetical protein